MIPTNSTASVEVRIGIHNTMKALKWLVETIDTDRLHEGLAEELEALATRIRERLGLDRASGPSGVAPELKSKYTFPDHAVVPHKTAEFLCGVNLPETTVERLKGLYRVNTTGRINSSKPNEANTPKPQCPDGLIPDGAECPRCGGPRAPSGCGGGSWVHYPRDHHESQADGYAE